MNSKISHRVGNWLFKGPLRSSAIHRVARAYCNVYNRDPARSCDSATNGEYDLLRRLIPRVKIVFDVGANVGDWTAETIRLNPESVVHAFEPVAGTRDIFNKKGFGPRVIFNSFGLSDRPERKTIYNYGDGSGLNSLHRRTDLEERNSAMEVVEESIELRTLDGYCDERNVTEIDFLKIDVEGHEFSILKGAKRLLSQRAIGAIQVEYGGSFRVANTLLRDVFDVVAPSGMVGGRIEPGKIRRFDAYHAKLEDFRLSNWIFARPDHPHIWTDG